MDQREEFFGDRLKPWQHWCIIIVGGIIGLGMTGYGVISIIIDVINKFNS